MRKFFSLGAIALGIVAAPASATLTVVIEPTLAYGTDTVAIFANTSGSVCGVNLCPGSGIFPYQTIVSPFVATQIADGPNGELRFSGQDRGFNTTTVSLFFNGGTLIGDSLVGLTQLSPFCPTGNLCRTDTFSYTASSFAVTLTDSRTGTSQILAPVPEPTTWAMMLLGFGAIGFAMRRRRPGLAQAV